MTTHYTCSGSVRGECGVAHQSLRTAEAHYRKDQRGCRAQGGYSDRTVVKVEDGRRYAYHGGYTDWTEITAT